MLEFTWREFPRIGERVGRCLHPSGMEVLFIPKARTQTYASLCVGIGSSDRSYTVGGKKRRLRPGVPHFLEHKLFANPDGTDASAVLGSLGAYSNAYTAPDSTCYVISCAGDRFCEALSELLRFASEPYFTEENVAVEADIITQEAAMYADRPASRLHKLMLSGLYRYHPLRDDPCGTRSDITATTVRELQKAYADFYHADNFTLLISGSADEDGILRVLESAELRRGEKPIPVPGREEIAPVPKRPLRAHMDVAIPLYSLGIRIPALPPSLLAKQMVEADLVDALLFRQTGLLYRDLYQKGLIHAPPETEFSPYRDTSQFVFAGESRSPEAVAETFWKTVAEAARSGFSESDLSRVKKALYADFIASLDSVEETVDNLHAYRVRGLDYFDYSEILNTVTAEDLQRLLTERYRQEESALAVILPKRA